MLLLEVGEDSAIIYRGLSLSSQLSQQVALTAFEQSKKKSIVEHR
jgi:hypothetical protein